jgi:tRNA(Ile)-lysidine synthase
VKIELEPGTYIVAVSGGVDSMALLDLLAMTGQRVEGREQRSKDAGPSPLTPHPWRLIVAHFDHGIREDSDQDRQLVQVTAEKYGLPFVYDEGFLGPKTSEATARVARYKFLQSVAQASAAKAIITAHHQDDMLETAIINMLRGTGRRGLTSLKDLPNLKRPLLKFTKPEIIDYAKKHHLEWREDTTNQDTTYLRNYIRHEIMPNLTPQQKDDLLKHIDKLGELNNEIDSIIDNLVGQQTELDRQWFISLDHKVALDVMANWLRSQAIKDFDSKRLELLVRAAKTYQHGKQIDINKANVLQIKKDKLALTSQER